MPTVSRQPLMILLTVSLALLVAGTVFWLRERIVREGEALATVAALRWDFGEVPPGQEVVLMLSGLRNRSDKPLTIREIAPIETRGDAGVAEVTGVELAPRSGPSRWIADGPFVVYPPGESSGRSPDAPCTFVEVAPVSGFQLEPRGSDGDFASLVTRFKALRPGDAAIRMARVEYELGGKRYAQTIPLTARFHVREGARPMSAYRSRGCLDEATVLSEGVE